MTWAPRFRIPFDDTSRCWIVPFASSALPKAIAPASPMQLNASENHAKLRFFMSAPPINDPDCAPSWFHDRSSFVSVAFVRKALATA